MIILIYLDSAAVQMFFPNKNDIFFIKEDELETLTFRKVFSSTGLGHNIDFFEKIFLRFIHI
jgi:hypothetical protein